MALVAVSASDSLGAVVWARTRGQGQRVMLVALTRKLAVMLWRYVETGAAAPGETDAASSMGFET